MILSCRIEFFLAIGLVLVYSAVVLIVISSTIWILDVFVSYLGNVNSGVFLILGTYLLYLSVISLSPMGKLEG
jgi:uncharacterized membrane protein (DUF2068 family)